MTATTDQKLQDARPQQGHGLAPILNVRGVSRRFPVGQTLLGRPRAHVNALDGVSLHLARGETLGLVGESGCGKSTLARLLAALDQPTSGDVIFEGRGLSDLSRHELHTRRRDVQMIFQDPYASLNPRMTARNSISEPLGNFTTLDRTERHARVDDLSRQVGLADHLLDRFPHELSGGQCQRVGIARAIAAEPKVIIADEPVSALDVSIQAQILNLLLDIRERMKLSMVFVSHDLSVVAHIADRVAVMYLGRIVETGPAGEVFANPRHPYTQMLIGSVPHPVPRTRGRRVEVRGELPSPLSPPSGCAFRTRCRLADAETCGRDVPALRHLGGVDVACFRVGENAGEALDV